MSSSRPHFRFRRQFVMGRSLDRPFADWQHVRFGPFDIYAHPDLALTERSEQAVQVVLLGYVFDPDEPGRTNADIVSSLAANDHYEKLLEELSGYGGTFALAYRNARESALVHDAAGLYEIYFTTDDDLLVASQPALLGRCTDLEQDRSPEAIQFFNSDGFRQSGHLWAGDRTIYSNVRHLLPNRYLDLETGRPRRYWPNKRRVRSSREEVADDVAHRIAGFIESALNRYSISIGVTAGVDSRVLLAASRPHRKDITYFIIPHPQAGSIDRADRRIAPRLTKRLGVPLSVRPYGEVVDPDFEATFEESITFGRRSVMSEWYDVFFRQAEEDMTINGNVSEVARLYFDRIERPTAEDLARLIFGEALPYTVKIYRSWLNEMLPICNRFDYDLLDLFYWEERMGNWAARGRSEMHLVTEVFTPYDSRRLLERLLSVDSSERQKLDNRLYRDIVRRLWPEALEEPINPRLKLRLSRWMRRLHIYGPVTRFISKLRT